MKVTDIERYRHALAILAREIDMWNGLDILELACRIWHERDPQAAEAAITDPPDECFAEALVQAVLKEDNHGLR